MPLHKEALDYSPSPSPASWALYLSWRRIALKLGLFFFPPGLKMSPPIKNPGWELLFSHWPEFGFLVNVLFKQISRFWPLFNVWLRCANKLKTRFHPRWFRAGPPGLNTVYKIVAFLQNRQPWDGAKWETWGKTRRSLQMASFWGQWDRSKHVRNLLACYGRVHPET